MIQTEVADSTLLTSWVARVAVGGVFAVNLGCAAAFISQPEQFAPAFEMGGLPGRIVVQALGILFLMWNATYPPVVLHPTSQMTLFGVVLVQQAIGLAGETWLWLHLPVGHSALWNTGVRFIAFDGIGLITMGVAYVMVRTTSSRTTPPRYATRTHREAQDILGH
jgi:hypothetical protein